MRVLAVLAAGLALPLSAAAVTFESDPTARTDITHCAVYLDSAPRTVHAVKKDAAGKPYCSIVLTVTDGAHTIQAAFAIEGPAVVPQEGPKSPALNFTQAAPITAVPSGWALKP
jgi:uncharacterized protein YigE (DUF2233 family)